MIIQLRRDVIVLSAVVVPILMFTTFYGFEFRLNLTPSYPLGLWQIVPLERPVATGDLVFICPPDNAAFSQALSRGYVRRGLCPGWLSPLIKTVVALPGQHVVVDAGVTIDGSVLEHSEIRGTDAEGRALSSWSGGVVPTGHLFLHSTFAGSYDSRYFGPIPASGVPGLARPILTVAP